jgi:hypothetical protein
MYLWIVHLSTITLNTDTGLVQIDDHSHSPPLVEQMAVAVTSASTVSDLTKLLSSRGLVSKSSGYSLPCR